jgi:ATP-dependent helicase/nuclease subunit B
MGRIDEAAIRACAEHVGEALRGELMLSSARNQYLLRRVEKTLASFVAAQREMLKRGSFQPARAAVAFGQGGGLPPLRVQTPGGSELLLRGKIDRVDLTDSGESAVFDYRLGSSPLSLGEVYHGLSLQLLTYLLVVQASGQELAGRPLTPTAAFYLQLLRRPGDVKHPSEALDPSDPKFHLRVKPRGVLVDHSVAVIDTQLETGFSEVVSAYRKQDGSFGRRGATDVADGAEFAALLGHVRRRLGELADRILSRDVGVAPYRLNRESPCPQCDYRSVCRFEPAVNHYRHLAPLRREDVLDKLRGAPEGGGLGG